MSLTRSRCRLTIRSARWQTCWPRHTSGTSPAAFTLAFIRTRSRTSTVGSTAKQRPEAFCRQPSRERQEQTIIVIEIVTIGRVGRDELPLVRAYPRVDFRPDDSPDERELVPTAKKSHHESYPIHKNHPVSRH